MNRGLDEGRADVTQIEAERTKTEAARTGSSLLLMLPVPVEQDEQGNLLFESQAANGLERWAENFDRLTVTGVRTPAAERTGTWTWKPVSELSCADRVEVVGLPRAFRPGQFWSRYAGVRRQLREFVARSRYLCFCISYSWGDWAALGALEAIRQGRPYAIWTDLVDHQVIHFNAGRKSLLRRLYGQHVDAEIVRRYHHHLIRHSRLGLFHGRDCFDAYAPICPNPHLVHNIHLKRADAIGDEERERKAVAVSGGDRLRIGYVGRALESKGPDDWLEVVRRLLADGHDVEATWLGDGPMLQEMQARVETLGLAQRVRFPGFLSDRAALLSFLKSCHLCLFCHKVLESPRSLIEALVCGCPLVGYDSPYPRDLISENGAGVLSPQNDVAALAEALAGLDRDRSRLADLIRRTADAADTFNDEAVFRHRSELIKQYL